MFVPYFTVDDNLSAVFKLKILFLVRRLRNIDVFIFLLCLLPLSVNLIYYVFINGQNRILDLFLPVVSLFKSSHKISDWLDWLGILQFTFVALVLSLRIFYSRSLFLKMQDFKKRNPGFKWNKKSKIWIMIFLPGVTFSVYRLLSKLTNFEALHKYNL